jgi:hypothetical protein
MMSAVRRVYVVAMMQIVARALVATSRADAEVRRELSILPRGYQIRMIVDPSGPGFVVESRGDGTLALAAAPKPQADLSIRYKHIAHAFLVLSFQEGTARAFANDRMVADGDVAHATRLVRCLNRMESLILPAPLARHAVKRYRRVPLAEKLQRAVRIYYGVAASVLGMK